MTSSSVFGASALPRNLVNVSCFSLICTSTVIFFDGAVVPKDGAETAVAPRQASASRLAIFERVIPTLRNAETARVQASTLTSGFYGGKSRLRVVRPRAIIARVWGTLDP